MRNLEKLKESIDTKSVIQLPARVGKSLWLRVKSTSGSVEGKLHFPKKDSGRLLIFEPGFPGDGSTRLERLWLNKLLKEGFTIFAARHNGTIINGRYSSTYLNCPAKQKRAKEARQKLLGNKKEYTISDWLKEPLIVLEALAPHYKEIYVVGHSFGGLAILSSLIDFSKKCPRHKNKIKRFISLAGTCGQIRELNDPILKQWLDYIDRDATRARIQIGSPKKNVEILKRAYLKIHREAKHIPQSLTPIFIAPWGDMKDSTDELVHPIEAVEMIATLGRGYLIIDKTQKANRKTGQLAHDMDNLKSKTLLKLLDRRFLPTSQISVIK